jgi:hypothetical protein
MNAAGWLLLLGGGAAAAAALGSKPKPGPTQTFFVGTSGSKPPPPPPKPATESGTQSLGDDMGRAWFTVPIDRNHEREREQVVATIADFGEGEIVCDVYEQIEPPHDVPWPEATACGVTRWILTFANGIMVSAEISGGVNGQGPVCFAGARPISKAYLRSATWVQRGNEVVLKIRTRSGIWKHPTQPWGKCVQGGQCDRWDNDFVESGHVLVDVMWKAKA